MKIAVTGGIGSGKSTVCSFIHELGFPVYSCDEIYSELTGDDHFCCEVSRIVGVKPLKEGGKLTLDRAGIAEKVFNNAAARKKLEEFTHPAIMSELLSRMQRHRICFAEVPLLFENNFQNLFDRTVIVLRDEESRISSLVNDRKMTREQALARIKNQYSYENIDKEKHTVIYNGSDLSELKRQVKSLIEQIVS